MLLRHTVEDVDGVNTFICPGADDNLIRLHTTFTGGWLRLSNNTIGPELDNVDALPVTRFPLIGAVFSSFAVETGNFDQAYPLHWQAIVGSGGSGGSVSFSLPQMDFIPWILPGPPPLMLPPGDNQTGALPLIGDDDND